MNPRTACGRPVSPHMTTCVCAALALVLLVTGEVKAEDTWRKLHDAIVVQGDLNSVKRLVPAATNANIRHPREKTTPLMWAVIADRSDIAEYLLSANADINAKDSQGLTPLMHAAVRGKWSLILLLLAQDADATLRDPKGRTARAFVAGYLIEMGKNKLPSTGDAELDRALAADALKTETMLLECIELLKASESANSK